MLFLPENDIRREVWARCESPIEQWLCGETITIPFLTRELAEHELAAIDEDARRYA